MEYWSNGRPGRSRLILPSPGCRLRSGVVIHTFSQVAGNEVVIVDNQDVLSLEGMWSEDRLCSLCLRFFVMLGESRDGADCPLWAEFGDPQELVTKGVVFEDLARYCRRYVPVRESLSLEDMSAARRFPFEGSP